MKPNEPEDVRAPRLKDRIAELLRLASSNEDGPSEDQVFGAVKALLNAVEPKSRPEDVQLDVELEKRNRVCAGTNRLHEPAEPGASPRLMISKEGEIHTYCAECVGDCSEYKPAAPQPVAGEGPRCNECGDEIVWIHKSQNNYRTDHKVEPKLAEGTPKLEEIAQGLLSWLHHYNLADMNDAELADVEENFTDRLRPFITPACSPAHDLLIVLRAQSGHRLNKWLEKYGLECHDSMDWLELQNNAIDAYLTLATPASTGEGDAKSFLGLPVYVDNPQFTGYGIAKYDSGDRKRVIGVLLENGNTWEYDAATVREARHEELPKMPRAIRERFSAPTSVPPHDPEKDFRDKFIGNWEGVPQAEPPKKEKA